MAEKSKLAIYMPIMDQFVMYDDRVLVFEDEAEVEKFKEDFADFFKHSPGAHVVKPVSEEFMEKNLVLLFSELSNEEVEKEKKVNEEGGFNAPPPSKQEMYRLLNTDFSPDKVAGLMPSVFARNLMENGVITSMADFNYLALEAIQHAFADDDEFPIHYYRKGEDMSERGRVVTDIGDCLTDDYIATNLANPT